MNSGLNLFGRTYNTVRGLDSVILQIKIQWFIEDIIDPVATPISEDLTELYDNLQKGCTQLFSDASANLSATYSFILIGKDLQGTLYKKECSIIPETEDQHLDPAGADDKFLTSSGSIFYVKTIKIADHLVYMLNERGVYMMINAAYIDSLKSSTDIYNVYEFNTMFPILTTAQTKVKFLNLEKILRIHSTNEYSEPIFSDELESSTDYINITDVCFNTNDYILVSQDEVYNHRVTLKTPEPRVIKQVAIPCIEYLNGIALRPGDLSAEFMLASPAREPVIPIIPDVKNIDITVVSGKGSCALLPTKIDGVGSDNKDTLSKYGITTITENDQFPPTPADDGFIWYASSDSTNLSILPNDEEGGGKHDTWKIADMCLQKDGNVGLYPATTANIVGFTPEYRVFNHDFTPKNITKRVKSTTTASSTNTGYFKLILNKKGEKYRVGDGSKEFDKQNTQDTAGYCIIKTNKEPEGFSVEVKVSSAYDVEGSVYLAVKIPPDVDITAITESSFLPKWISIIMMSEAENTERERFILLGRVEEDDSKLNVYQDFVGTPVFDFTSVASSYNGAFAITVSKDSYKVNGGTVRIINQSRSVSAITASKGQTVYLEVTMNSAKLTAGSSVPASNDDTQYLKIGSISSEGVITQDQYGDGPLFLFFSTECVDEDETTE